MFPKLVPGTMVGEYRVDGAVNREIVDRFIQEARSVNQIGHPNIVDIFALGTMPDGRCYFVMEWMRGLRRCV